MKKNTMRKLYAPVICMLLLLALIITEQTGFMTKARAPLLDWLDAAAPVAAEAADTAETLFLYNSANRSEAPFANQNRDVFRLISLPYLERDLNVQPLGDLSGISTVLICTQQLSPLTPDLERLFAWVEAGGHLGLMITPSGDSTFNLLSRKLGIIETRGEYQQYSSLRFLTDMLPLYEYGGVYADRELDDYLLQVRLSEDCTVHIETGDSRHYPILWERPLGEGRVAVFNASLLSEKANRGLTLCTLFAVEDTVVYPIINAGLVFIDDFPAPQPEGRDERLQQDFGYNIQGFFRNRWWPDMKQLVYRHGLRYTGVLVETYNTRVEPPFEPDSDERALLRYYASEMMHAGGEIGLHGYNHMPLCPDGFVYNGDNYVTWPSTDNMALAVEELFSYGSRILPEANFASYVPPSNYLSAEGQATLRETLPQISAISGLYLPEANVNALVQEFQEENDGSVSVPRITSGFSMNAYNQFVMAESLLFHGVFSHFIHPDDVLDDKRGAVLGWNALYADFDNSMQRMNAAYHDLRHSTVSEGAAAVQRYNRLTLSRSWANQHTLNLTLNGFVDEAWLALRTRNNHFTVEGGVAYPVNDHLIWLHAQSAELRLVWEAEP